MVFSGETLAAFQRTSVTTGRIMERSITAGKSAQFPAFGRTNAHYLKAGKNLDDIRETIQNGERTIVIDGLLTADTLIFDLDEFIAHYDFRSPYASELGNALAISHDASVLAEIAKEALNTSENVAGLGKGGVITQTLDTGITGGINKQTGLAIYQILLQAKAAMSKNYVPSTDRYAYVTPEYHAALASALEFLNHDYGASGNLLEGDVIRLAGFDIIECPHLTKGGDDNTNVIQGSGHIFPAAYASKSPIIICHKTSAGVLRLQNLSMESGRRIEYQADQIIAKMAVGVGGLRPECSFLGIVANASA
ncbi:phage capsid protein [Pectinatus frisingensis]|uniref:phage capsid protein n=1 Tax=Pectinatus frisingensis TaxID=865 RepID=UPI0018C72267|nr:phage capsid protein [Pectinatus frisingensis]